MNEMFVILENALESVLDDPWHAVLAHETLEKVKRALRQVKEERRRDEGND
jgi:hypothetical protein